MVLNHQKYSAPLMLSVKSSSFMSGRWFELYIQILIHLPPCPAPESIIGVPAAQHENKIIKLRVFILRAEQFYSDCPSEKPLRLNGKHPRHQRQIITKAFRR